MPRHRRERVPLYRTRRSAVHAARRVPLSAAFEVPAPDAAEEPPPVPPVTEAADHAEATATVPMPAFRRRLLQISSPAGPIALGGASPVARATRRLMVTPWFAVAAGIVVAAGVWIYSPQASLQFPVGKGGEQQCNPPLCKSTHQQIAGAQAGGGLPVMSGGEVGKVPAAAPRKVTYRLLWQSQGRIFMLITITGEHPPKKWKLKFAMPGVEITGVDGAHWQRSGTSSGTASWPVAPWQTAGLGGGGNQYGSARWYAAGRSFIVVGTGVPMAPDNCSFNGKSCQFTPAARTEGQAAPTGLQSR